MKRSHRVHDAAKRALDALGALVLLVALAPVLALTALLVHATLGSPVLFRQQRPGLGGVPFTLYKFRTMRETAVRDVEAVASDAERLTPIGRAIRASSLDELPELWNILRGDMSFVGPRPLLMEYLGRYNEVQARRHEVRPGLTGWAQVHGRNDLEWDRRLALDVWYVENRSPLLDLKILLMTFGTVLKGLTAEGTTAAAPFDPEAPAASRKEDS
ncbi:MAG: sugar transferase [Coriobacteriia bacterium]